MAVGEELLSARLRLWALSHFDLSTGGRAGGSVSPLQVQRHVETNSLTLDNHRPPAGDYRFFAVK